VPADPEARPSRLAHGATLTAAVVIAAVLLYVSLRGIDWSAVLRRVRGADGRLLALTAVIGVWTMFLRAWRWRILLNAEARVSVSAAFWATAACQFGNNLMPARAGELVRTYMIDAEYRLGKTYVLATAIAERIADAIVLVTIGALALLTMTSPPGWLAGAAKPFAFVGLAGAAAIAVLPLMGPALERAILATALPQKWRGRLVAAVEQGLRGFRAFHDVGRVAAFIALALVIWIFDAIGTVIAGAALGLTIRLPVAFLLMAGLGLGSSIPSTPGYVGIYQFVSVSILTPFGISREGAIAYILVSQAIMYVVIAVLGAMGLYRQRRLSA
jgi:glycosyltransferase 2 family protein